MESVTSIGKVMSTKIVFLGVLPPPVHGLSIINQSVHCILDKVGIISQTIDLSPKTLQRSAGPLLKRGLKALVEAIKLVIRQHPNQQAMYIGLSGGVGQIYDLIFIGIARCLGLHLYLHHHSYAYFNNHSVLTSALVNIAGNNATHIVLSKGMGEDLREQYSAAHQIFPLSNIAFLDSVSVTEVRNRKVRTIGFLGNISAAKGIDHFLDTVAELEQQGITIRALIAGPFADSATEQRVRERAKKLSSVSIIGPVYGAEKSQFFTDIDVLLFPSIYINEAEPVTIHEAMAASVPVIATSRGTIREILANGAGVIVDDPKQYAEIAAAQIRSWKEEPETYQSQSQRTFECHKHLRELYSSRLQELLNLMVGASQSNKNLN